MRTIVGGDQLILGDTLREARLRLLRDLDAGALCPCCGRYAKKYRRKLNSGMARDLLRMARMETDPEGWISWSDVWHSDGPEVEGKPGNEFSKLRFWDLIEQGEAGMWRVTRRGRRFALGHIRVPRHCFVFDNRRQGFSDDSTDIHEALGDPFLYTELMEGSNHGGIKVDGFPADNLSGRGVRAGVGDPFRPGAFQSPGRHRS